MAISAINLCAVFRWFVVGGVAAYVHVLLVMFSALCKRRMALCVSLTPLLFERARVMEISLVPGDYDVLMSELNRVTKGEFQFDVQGQGVRVRPGEADGVQLQGECWPMLTRCGRGMCMCDDE